MKFDYYHRNINLNRQISHHDVSQEGINSIKSRKLVRFKRIHNKSVVFCLILVEILIILLGAGYYISSLSRISNVSVRGNHTIMRQSIVSDMNSKPGESVLRLMNHRIHFERSTFNQNAQLKSMSVKIHHWNVVDINVNEYPIIAYLGQGHHYFAVSNNGKRAYQDTRPNQVDPILFGFRSNQVLDSFVKSYKRIPDSIKPDITKIYYVPTKIDPYRIRVKMNDGNQIYANFKNWDHKMRYYPAISRSMKKSGNINLELGAYSSPFKRSNHK